MERLVASNVARQRFYAVMLSVFAGVAALDPQTFIAVSLLFGLVATVASYLPARRATAVDPMVALRSE